MTKAKKAKEQAEYDLAKFDGNDPGGDGLPGRRYPWEEAVKAAKATQENTEAALKAADTALGTVVTDLKNKQDDLVAAAGVHSSAVKRESEWQAQVKEYC